MNLAPIALFVYNRLTHTRQAVEALAENDLANGSDLFIFSDGPRTEADVETVASVREHLSTLSGFNSVTIVGREKNLGCARSIISGVSEIVNRFGRIIVVEDDIVTSPHFLRFMNEALELYRDDEEVASIHGYLYPVKRKLPETFFLRGADIWGWATWQRGWNLFQPDGKKLLDELKERKLTKAFDLDGAFYFTSMLESQVAGRLDTWDINWHASAYLRGKLTLYPGKSLTRNIGNDNSGTHSNATDRFDTEISPDPVRIQRIPLGEDPAAREAIKEFFRSLTPPRYQRALARFGRMISGRGASRDIP